MSKLNVLLVYGGESPEHEVSVNSSKNVYQALLTSGKYDLSLCFITKQGEWKLVKTVEFEPADQIDLIPEIGHGGFVTSSGEKIKPDVLVPILHGENGEDGTVQGLAKLLHIPYAGPSLESAAVTLNKDLTKRLLRDVDIPVVPWVTLNKFQAVPKFDELAEEFGEALFVKPLRAGSSVGVHKVTNQEQLDAAMTDALKYDDEVIIEQAISAREIEVSALGNYEVKVSSPAEIIPGEEFYTYEDKYSADSKSSFKLPAELDPELVKKIQDYAVRAYQVVAGRGMSRIDFFLEKGTDKIYLNEINTIPGFTNASMYPKMWQASGLETPDLVDQLVQLALELR